MGESFSANIYTFSYIIHLHIKTEFTVTGAVVFSYTPTQLAIGNGIVIRRRSTVLG
jgi:hypothetical protein